MGACVTQDLVLIVGTVQLINPNICTLTSTVQAPGRCFSTSVSLCLLNKRQLCPNAMTICGLCHCSPKRQTLFQKAGKIQAVEALMEEKKQACQSLLRYMNAIGFCLTNYHFPVVPIFLPVFISQSAAPEVKKKK